MIDSHCHLADSQFDNDLPDVLLRAEEHGVHAMLCIADTIKESEKCLTLAEKYEQIFCTIGVHPHAAKDWQDSDIDQLKSWALRYAHVKALGEMGLDYHYDNSPRDVQQLVFRDQLQLAKELELPAVIHNRESLADLTSIVYDVEPPAAVLHCCTEPWDAISDWVDRGYWLSFTGIATYSKSDAIRDTIKHCPIEQLMIETDAPYLMPRTIRPRPKTRRNEPCNLVHVLEAVASSLGAPVEEIAASTARTAEEFFGLGD